MKERQTVHDQLEDLRKERGLTLEELSKLTGISRTTLGDCEKKPDKDISHRHLLTLAKFYGVSMDYLFGLTENRKHPNAELSELHLSDGVIELLKTGKVNNRLLCEIVTHKDFIELMADAEIYVDGIATRRFRDLNASLEVVRQKIIHEYQPTREDNILRTLKATQIQEENFFCHVTHRKLDAILHDIRAAHVDDDECDSDTSTTLQMIQTAKQIMNQTKNGAERFCYAILGALGIKFDKFTSDEKATFITFMKKSPIVKKSIHKKRK